MILHGNQRGGAKDLALHLMKEENDHVEVHEIRGFASDNLMDAFQEAHAISRGTRCKQFLFSLSLNPPPSETVSIAAFEDAVMQVEERLGLTGQPRAIIFHEKEGRRHAHAVWSRIKIDEMKAVQLSFSHEDLREVSRRLFIQHGWEMPHGLLNSEARNPKNFTLEEWQQSKRTGKDPKAIKHAFQDAWAISDSKAAYIHAMEERGYIVARGDRGRFVAIDHLNEVYSIPRQVGLKTKQVRDKLGDGSDLPDVEQARYMLAEGMIPAFNRFSAELKAQALNDKTLLLRDRDKLVQEQRQERQVFAEQMRLRRVREAQTRQARFRKGLKGIWDRLRGEHKRLREQNEQEARQADARDRREKEQLIAAQLAQRRLLQQRIDVMRQHYRDSRRDIERDRERFTQMTAHQPSGPSR